MRQRQAGVQAFVGEKEGATMIEHALLAVLTAMGDRNRGDHFGSGDFEPVECGLDLLRQLEFGELFAGVFRDGDIERQWGRVGSGRRVPPETRMST
jgi:hypothetical protein